MHLEKIANGAESQILQHDGRDLSHHSNKNIDTKKSHLNYCLTEQDGKTALQRFKDRLNECSYRKQKNNVRMESIVITAPKNLKAEDTALFFKVAHKALQGLTGGKNNEVGAWVHLDEKSPHMHYDFVPAIEINGVLKLSAKNLMNREKLSILHPTMQAAIDKAFGHHEYIVVADDPADRQQSSDTIHVYKAKQAKVATLNKQIQQAADGLQLAKEQEDDALTSIMLTFQQKAAVDKEVTAAKQQQKELQDKISLLSAKAEKADLWLHTLDNATSQRTDKLSDLSEKVERLEQYLQDNQYMSECVELRQYLEEYDPDYMNDIFAYLHGDPVPVQQADDWAEELGL
ncbi:MAG: plasmid recombination protein [Blautia sp.]|nr:plasmid recombination protein [Blautia sp.]